jgi:hypothetical protein
MVALLRFAVAAMLPGSDRFPSSAELGLGPFVARFLRETSWAMWLGCVASAAAFMALPVLTIFVPLPAVLLPARLLDRHAAAMADHRIYLVRQSAFLLKMVAGLHWGAHPEVRQRLGLAPYAADPGTWRTS